MTKPHLVNAVYRVHVDHSPPSGPVLTNDDSQTYNRLSFARKKAERLRSNGYTVTVYKADLEWMKVAE